MLVRTARLAGREQRGAGQALAEFALVLPILVLVFMGLIEVALAYNATVGINRASQNGAHLAAIMGNQLGADCLILREIEGDVVAPNDKNKIMEVLVERTNRSGNPLSSPEQQTYSRTGSMTCTLPDSTSITLPYTRTVNDYPEAQRCNALKGCTGPPFTSARTTVDNIAVSIRYRHRWVTPLNAMFDFFAGNDVGWTIVQRNVFRIEPVL